MATRVAIVGCGFVADYYVTTLPNHPELELAGVYDRDAERARRFAGRWGAGRVYDDLDELLDDPIVEIVLNLTNPRNHAEVTRSCLLADKHVYSEKPLALTFEEAEALVRLAEERGLSLSGAPCNLLGEAAQTTWKALRDGLPGTVRLVYAELDEDMVHREPFRDWRSPSGLPWPHVDEFQTGIALEHAGYYVSWLLAFFGPVSSVTAFASVRLPEKAPEVAPERMKPDFTVACLEFASGLVARVTCSLSAEHDHRLRIFGDRGVLSCADCWMYGSPVYFERPLDPGFRPDRVLRRSRLLRMLWTRYRRRLPLVRPSAFQSHSPPVHVQDFARGVAEQAAALREARPPRLSAQFLLHLNEVVLAMQPDDGASQTRAMRSTCGPVDPMPWA